MTPPNTAHHVEAQPGALVQTRADRHLAAGQWLLSAAEDTQRARKEWAENGITLLRCGTLFTAVRLAASLVHAAADSNDLRDVDAYLGQALLGGPVFADTRWRLYYALVPEGTGRLPSWSYRSEDAECLGPNAYLGVPDPTHTDPGVGFSYWCVPPHDPETLCSPEAVAQLLKDGLCRLTVAEANTGA
ncbi:hypothetical protein AQJ91_21875 [Streptomyces dysideae]|uniref:Uncharacterized protein n=2 Tax=Streptomyces dysideae TaxID=909626 RepID=A0A101UYD5_9ACTN|nr:hypothetical protein AQJ91_21875 [Streptomyces dysideae]